MIDQPNGATLDALGRLIGNRHILMLLDNCEHLLDACAELIVALLGTCPGLKVLATSREPIALAGEVTWRVPGLSPDDAAIELFTDRARLVKPAFEITDKNSKAVREICQRLDGIPLAIELAAARVRSLSVAELASGLDDRFGLLTSSARAVVRRQRTLRASLDWSYARLTQPEQVLFRRLAVFTGGFDFAAVVEVVAARSDDLVERYQVLDQLTLLVDKCLVVAEDWRGRTRYRLLETVREYAREKLNKSEDGERVRLRHHAHYTTIAAKLSAPGGTGHEQRLQQAETEIDNLRAAFTWSHDNGDIASALQLACALHPLWSQGRVREGLTWLDSILEGKDSSHLAVPAGIWAQALAEKAILNTWLTTSSAGFSDSAAAVQKALALAHDASDSAVMVRVIVARGCSSGYSLEAAQPYFSEAMELARAIDDKWTVSEILYWQLVAACRAGQPTAVRTAAAEAQDFAESIGNLFVCRQCRIFRSMAKLWEGDLAGALAASSEAIAAAEVDAPSDTVTKTTGLFVRSQILAYSAPSAAGAAADAALEAAAELGGVYEGMGHAAMTRVALATGDTAAIETSAANWDSGDQRNTAKEHLQLIAQSALARGDVVDARDLADAAVLGSKGWHRMAALIVRARIGIAKNRLAEARDDAHAALAHGVLVQTYLGMPDAIELLAGLAAESGSHQEATRLYGAAAAQRQRTGEFRFKIWDAGHKAAVVALRDAMGNDFNAGWAEGTAMTLDEALTYAQRGRGERKRPERGWDSLTPTEHNVVQLVIEGLPNKDIATRLFISPRTVQTHLTHIYAKLHLTSRVQLVQEATRYS